MPETQELPLFPLRTVLFPGGTIPLQIFEERYRAMLQDCLASDGTLGVCLIRPGDRTGGRSAPHTVGTLAQVSDVQPLAEGGTLLTATGRSRFQVETIVREQPYLLARVTLLPEVGGESDAGLVQQVRDALDDYLRLMAEVQGEWVRDRELPEDSQLLSFTVGSAVTGSLRARQQLLEASTIGDRLELGLTLLQRESRRLRRELEERRPYRPSVN